jgi:hypothetical protein
MDPQTTQRRIFLQLKNENGPVHGTEYLLSLLLPPTTTMVELREALIDKYSINLLKDIVDAQLFVHDNLAQPPLELDAEIGMEYGRSPRQPLFIEVYVWTEVRLSGLLISKPFYV